MRLGDGERDDEEGEREEGQGWGREVEELTTVEVVDSESAYWRGGGRRKWRGREGVR